MYLFLRGAALVWASPWTTFGLVLGLLGLFTGGRVRLRPPIIEFHGGAVTWLLARYPIQAIAITFGHTVLGQTGADLDRSRTHELVHVRQYERWGPLFVPAYLVCSLVLWLQGKQPYYDNPFEREACAGDRRNN